MIDLDVLSSPEQLAYASGILDALAQIDHTVGGKRSAAIGPVGAKLQKRAASARRKGTHKTVLEPPEAIRQSLIAKFDQCPLSTRFELETAVRQLDVLGARGTLFHVFAARAVNHMRAHRERAIPVDVAMELLTEVIAQRDVPDDEVVHLPMRELRWLRVLVTKWAYQQTFSIERVVDVERRLSAEIPVIGPRGRVYMRTVSGKPDVLLVGPGRDEATVVDWKSGFAPPSAKREPRPGEAPVEDRLSDMGYVQQVVYGVLVLLKHSHIQRVTEREFYVMSGEVREATVERSDMERILDVLAAVVAQMDAAIEAGPQSARWFPVAGTHCGFCPRPRDCPIKDELGIPTTLRQAQRLAQEWIVAGELRKNRLPLLKGYYDAHGPIPIRHAKGRREVGWIPNKTGEGQRFTLYEPEEAPESPFDPLLEQAARDAGVLAA